MTIKESILKSLEDLNGLASTSDIYNHIIDKNYYKFGAKNPLAIVSTRLGEFIKNTNLYILVLKYAGNFFIFT
ncbi:hypothetical protein [Myroides odoratimimus]|uniref:hypothetical protein n=1 Tax=Myroides odoratimimus TaxID=76832 RepID=UPI002DBB4934|nr:hypothetical protein [Myroides odoratimimus]MEC4028518.1 hypothetical protein [Myroides odoratimimus]